VEYLDTITRSLSDSYTSLIDKFNKFINNTNEFIERLFVVNLLKYSTIVVYRTLIISGFVVNPLTIVIVLGGSIGISDIVAKKYVYDTIYPHDIGVSQRVVKILGFCSKWLYNTSSYIREVNEKVEIIHKQDSVSSNMRMIY
jgi:hypothetical protein